MDAFHTETIEHAGQTVRIEYFYDDTYWGNPWEESCGHVNIQTKSVDFVALGQLLIF